MGRTRSRQGRSGLCPPPGLRQGSWRLNKWPTEFTVAPKSCCCFFSFQTAICRGWQRVPSWTCESLASKVGPCGPSLWFLVLPQRDLPLLPGCWSPCQGPALLPLLRSCHGYSWLCLSPWRTHICLSQPDSRSSLGRWVGVGWLPRKGRAQYSCQKIPLGWYFQSPEQPLEGAGVGLKGRRGGEAQVLARGHVVSE